MTAARKKCRMTEPGMTGPEMTGLEMMRPEMMALAMTAVIALRRQVRRFRRRFLLQTARQQFWKH